MTQPTEKIQVRLVEIRYMGWKRLEVAVDVLDPKALYVTYPTVESILNYRHDSVREKIASKSLKTFLSQEPERVSRFGKKTATIVNKDLVGIVMRVNLITLEDLQLLAKWEIKVNNNLDLLDVVTAGFSDSLRSIALEQLGVKLEVDERNDWMVARLAGKEERRNFTDSIKEHYLSTHPDCDKVPFCAFSSPSNTLNLLLTGHPAKYWRDRFGFETDEQLRNHWCKKQLKRIEHVEELARAKVDQGLLEPVEAVRYAVAELGYQEWTEEELLGTNDPKTRDRNRKRLAKSRTGISQQQLD